MNFGISISFMLLFLSACFILYREKLLTTNQHVIIAIAFLTLAFAIRIPLLSYKSGDYQIFLVEWVSHFRNNGGFFGLRDVVGNYNLPYLYFLAFFSYIPLNDLYLIKFLSIAFDLVLALGISRIVLHYTESKGRQLAAFLITLFFPTVVLNGAYWGQCDSIFTAFAIWAFYKALKGKPKASLIFGALSITFKIQAIFFLPIYLVFLYKGQIHWKDIWVAPATFVASLLPAVLFGHPIVDALTVYFRQVGGGDGALNYNSCSIYSFIPYNYHADWLPYAGAIGIALALALVYGVLFWTFAFKEDVNNITLLGFAAILTLGIPLFLPHMHDRYFFLADMFTLALVLVKPRYIAVSILCFFGSFLGYYAYLKAQYLMPMKFGAIGLIIAFIMLCYFIYDSRYIEENTIES